ncbi:hypothetical protein TRFO_11759 [Tritrichomonas foetus]|uniref:Protein regulator of cytokinesis 1 n=1 Tax=Tritrichomonas foetus TaxID=1144522 RepID=A0A1J4J233_9EUKA|nr:hypothetical protein TRFO_11759 [Tritrichomonas foetus]|eukprot:OHS93542.1 hypothetical protein TRFO_11759 [Tritrichomonas foetus]
MVMQPFIYVKLLTFSITRFPFSLFNILFSRIDSKKMKIEINIEAQLEEIWRDIGLKSSDVEHEYQLLNEKVQELFREFLRENYLRRQALLQELEDTENEIVDLQIKFGLSQSEQEQYQSLPLIERVKSLSLQLKTLHAATAHQRREYENLYKQLTNCFDILEIEERGDFSELGSDYTREKIDRMTQFLDKMNQDIEERKPEMHKLFSEIQELRASLKLDPLDDTGKLGDQTFDTLETEREKLIQTKEKNYRKCQKLYVEINRLEKVLGRDISEPDFSDISDYQITQLKNQLYQLDNDKETRTPEYINDLKVSLLQLWKELHIKVPAKAAFPYYYSTKLNKRTLIALENEVLRLTTIKQQLEPTLVLINDRQKILSEFERLQAEEGNSKRLTNRKGGAAMALLEEERIRKQYNYKLPKIHEQLIPQLQEYKDNYGEPLLWDGEDLLEIVTEMHAKETTAERKAKNMTQREIRNHEKTRTGRPLKSSPRRPQSGFNKTVI